MQIELEIDRLHRIIVSPHLERKKTVLSIKKKKNGRFIYLFFFSGERIVFADYYSSWRHMNGPESSFSMGQPRMDGIENRK